MVFSSISEPFCVQAPVNIILQCILKPDKYHKNQLHPREWKIYSSALNSYSLYMVILLIIYAAHY